MSVNLDGGAPAGLGVEEKRKEAIASAGGDGKPRLPWHPDHLVGSLLGLDVENVFD